MKNHIIILFLSLITFSLSAQNESEPNNSFGQANLIEFDALYEGKVLESGDVDYFKFEVTEPGIIVVLVDNVPSEIDADVTVYSCSLNSCQIAESISTGYGETVVITIKTCTSGFHYVKIKDGTAGNNNETSQNPYVLRVTFNTEDSGECNDSFETATETNLSGMIEGHILSAGDLDFYKLEVPQNGILYVKADNIPSEIDIDVHVYDAPFNGSEIASNIGAGYGETSSILIKTCNPGTHYILLKDGTAGNNNAISFDKYTLFTSFDTNDSYECNDSFDDAEEIPFCENVNGHISSDGDKDFFKFQVPTNEVYDVIVDNVSPTIDMDLILYDAPFNSSEIASSISTGYGETAQITKTLESGVTYYLQLKDGTAGDNNASSLQLYTLLVTNLSGIGDCDPTSLVESGNSNIKIQISPNPFSDNVTIQSPSPIQSIQIFDAIGNQVFFQKEESFHEINTTNWQSGIYFILIQTEAGLVSKKLVKQ